MSAGIPTATSSDDVPFSDPAAEVKMMSEDRTEDDRTAEFVVYFSIAGMFLSAIGAGLIGGIGLLLLILGVEAFVLALVVGIGCSIDEIWKAINQ